MVKYARCNSLLSLALNQSGEGCRFMAKADTEQEVVDEISNHMKSIHEVDASELVNSIRAAVKTTRN